MRIFSIMGLGLALIACDDAPPAGTDGGAPGSDAGGSSAPSELVVELRDPDDAALAGVAVALDRPDGTREELTVDASGRATLSVDWSAGDHALTFYASGHTVQSWVNINETSVLPLLEDGVLVVAMASNAEPELATLSGTITGSTDSTHQFAVVPDVFGATSYQGNGPMYTMEVPVGVSFGAAVVELTSTNAATNELTRTIHAWRNVEIDAVTADTMRDLDLSSPDTLVTVDGTLASPGMGTPLADGALSVAVFDADTGAFLGLPTSIAPSGSDLAYTLAFAMPSSTTRPATRFSLNDEPNNSSVVVDGWPTDGPRTESFLPPPDIVTPAFGTTHPLHEPFELGRIAPGVTTALLIEDANDDERRLWRIQSLSGSLTIEIPELPSAAPEAEVLPPGADLYARPFVCELHESNDYCARLAVGRRQFDLMP